MRTAAHRRTANQATKAATMSRIYDVSPSVVISCRVALMSTAIVLTTFRDRARPLMTLFTMVRCTPAIAATRSWVTP